MNRRNFKMFKSFSVICSFVCISLQISGFANADSLQPKEIPLMQPEKKIQRKSPIVKAAFSPFTGKIKGKKVRMRLQPDLDGYIIRELEKNEFISVVDQEGDFWCVSPPEIIKAFIFRSFVLDNVVEGNRVNVRLEPDLEAPIIGHFNSGDHVEGTVSSKNKKWLEISPPSTTRFYIAKEFIEFAGGPDLKIEMDSRKNTVQELMETASNFSKEEMNKFFEDIDFDQIKKNYLTIIQDYTDFPQYAEIAKEAFTQVQENYLQKRIHYLETKANNLAQKRISNKSMNFHEQMQMWEPIEESLYLSWAQLNEEQDIDAYYEKQKNIAISISGTLENYTADVKNKPGDFILKNNNLRIACVYSTIIDLHNHVGKNVTLIASPRPNNHFAFPAYFIHAVE